MNGQGAQGGFVPLRCVRATKRLTESKCVKIRTVELLGSDRVLCKSVIPFAEQAKQNVSRISGTSYLI